jgi:hypothetical protein
MVVVLAGGFKVASLFDLHLGLYAGFKINNWNSFIGQWTVAKQGKAYYTFVVSDASFCYRSFIFFRLKDLVVWL